MRGVKKSIRLPWLAAGLLVLALGTPSAAQAGFADLDPGFGGFGGINRTDLGGYDSARAVAVDPTGQIVAAGAGALNDPSRPGGTALTVVRLNENGYYDPAFGGGDGIVQADPGRYTAEFESVGFDPRGRIVAVGTATGFDGAGSNLVVARYLPDGTLDPSFGTGGLVTLGGSGIWLGVDSLTDGDELFVLALTDGPGGARPTVLRLQPDGTIDPSFGPDGQLRLVTPKLERATSMVRSGDDLLISGTTTGGAIAAAKLTADGDIARDWGRAGFAAVKFPGRSDGYAVAVDVRGRALLAGECLCTRGPSAAVARLSRGGDLDESFDDDGRRTFRLGGENSGSEAVAMTTDGGRKAILGVVVANGGNRRSSLVRLTGDGSFDRKFSGDGVTSPGYGAGFGGDVVADLTRDGSGRILAADTLFGATPDFVVARFKR